MPFTPKNWIDETDPLGVLEGGAAFSTTPLNAAALEDLEERLSDYTDSVIGLKPHFNVKEYGALGDGNADDTAEIQAAIDAAESTGGIVYLPPGTYIVSLALNPDVADFYACLWIPSNVTLCGAGKTATIIKMAASQADHASASIIQNARPDTGNVDIAITNLTVDGNGANQTEYVWGVQLFRVRNSSIGPDVRIKNVFGDDDTPPGETFHGYYALSADCEFNDVEVVGDAGTQGSALGSGSSSNISYRSCRARLMSVGHGFAQNTSRGVLLENCVSTQNGGAGFNDEVSEVQYVNCIAGGRASSVASLWYSANQDLGNTGNGFICNNSLIHYHNCHATYNNDNGLRIGGTTNSKVFVIGGRYSFNGAIGISFQFDADARQSWVSKQTEMLSNTTAQMDTPASGNMPLGPDWEIGTNPAVPATATNVPNRWPFDCDVYISGSTDFNQLDEANVGTNSPIRVRVGGNLKLNYSGAAPTWVWARA